MSRVAETVRGLAAITAVARLCVASSAQAQNRIPDDAPAFVKWCIECGFSTKDARGETCAAMIALDVASVLAASDDHKCAALEKKLAKPDVPGLERLYARPIYDWMRANPKRTTGKVSDAVADALAALYGCKD